MGEGPGASTLKPPCSGLATKPLLMSVQRLPSGRWLPRPTSPGRRRTSASAGSWAAPEHSGPSGKPSGRGNVPDVCKLRSGGACAFLDTNPGYHARMQGVLGYPGLAGACRSVPRRPRRRLTSNAPSVGAHCSSGRIIDGPDHRPARNVARCPGALRNRRASAPPWPSLSSRRLRDLPARRQVLWAMGRTCSTAALVRWSNPEATSSSRGPSRRSRHRRAAVSSLVSRVPERPTARSFQRSREASKLWLRTERAAGSLAGSSRASPIRPGQISRMSWPRDSWMPHGIRASTAKSMLSRSQAQPSTSAGTSHRPAGRAEPTLLRSTPPAQ